MICEEAIDLAPFVQVFPSPLRVSWPAGQPLCAHRLWTQSIKQRIYRLKREAEVVSWGSRGHSKVFSALSTPPWGHAMPEGLTGRLKVCAEERNRKQENENEKRKEGKGRKPEMGVPVARGQTHDLTMTAAALGAVPPAVCAGRRGLWGPGLCLTTWASFPYFVHSF